MHPESHCGLDRKEKEIEKRGEILLIYQSNTTYNIHVNEYTVRAGVPQKFSDISTYKYMPLQKDVV